MKNAMRLITATALAALMTLGFATAGHAADDDYFDPTVTITGAILIGGNEFDYAAEASVECDTWTVEYAPATNGPTTQTGNGGMTFTGTYDTPPVDETTDTTITVTCEYTAPDAMGGAEVQAAATVSASNTVTLLPLGSEVDGDADGGDADGDGLPGAGGSSLWILLLGGALVLIGGGAYAASRRRA